MKILLIHNYYKNLGGEDIVYENEFNLLKNSTNKIFSYTKNNNINIFKLSYEFICNSTWSTKTYLNIQSIIRNEKIDIVHVHNFFPIISPSVFYAAKDNGAKTVFTLHNYRIIDPGALLMNNDHIDEKVLHDYNVYKTSFEKRYDNSFWQTLRIARMIEYHKSKKTWHNQVDRFIVLTDFSKSKFLEAGFPSNKFLVKPNFVSDPYKDYPELKQLDAKEKSGFVFVGRISKEKGLHTLIKAWKKIPKHINLHILGDGPLKSELEKDTFDYKNINWLGQQSRKEVFKIIKKSKALILPSICYETFALTAVESFAVETPVIVSNIGGQKSIVKHGHNGFHFKVSDENDLLDKVMQFENKREIIYEYGAYARKTYESKFTPQINKEMLINMYEKLLSGNE